MTISDLVKLEVDGEPLRVAGKLEISGLLEDTETLEATEPSGVAELLMERLWLADPLGGVRNDEATSVRVSVALIVVEGVTCSDTPSITRREGVGADVTVALKDALLLGVVDKVAKNENSV